jgi:outer membrane protein assembly factor BamB
MATPAVRDGCLYGVDAYGELICVKADSGRRLWGTYKAVTGDKAFCGTAFLIEQGGRYFLFNDQGELLIARLTPKGYEEIDRARLLRPTQETRGRTVVWSHPAFADRRAYLRNDEEIICVSLAAPGPSGEKQ